MSEKAYNAALSVTACFAVLVFLCGCFSCVFYALQTSSAYSQTAEAAKTECVAEYEETIVDTTSPETFESLTDTVTRLKYRYPNYLRLYTAGYSEGGRELLMYTLGNGAKKALIVGGIHAREHITVKYLLKVTEDYCIAATSGGFYGDYDIYGLLNDYTFYIVPCVNPDGVEIILSRDKAQPGVRISALSEYKANKNGVDINRNFPLAWESIDNGVNSPSDYFFKGYESASESETRALMTLCDKNDFDFMLSVHIKGNLLYWGDTYNNAYNAKFKAFAQDLASACSLKMTEPTDKAKNYGGGFENWFRNTYAKPGVCVELSDYENKIKPCGDENYADFSAFVNYPETAFLIAAAACSQNK